jgi:hypothetical protein
LLVGYGISTDWISSNACGIKALRLMMMKTIKGLAKQYLKSRRLPRLNWITTNMHSSYIVRGNRVVTTQHSNFPSSSYFHPLDFFDDKTSQPSLHSVPRMEKTHRMRVCCNLGPGCESFQESGCKHPLPLLFSSLNKCIDQSSTIELAG